MKGCVQVRYLCNHEYTKLCNNGETMNLPSPDLMPSQGVHLGTDLHGGEVISGHYADPSIRHGVAGLETSFCNLSLFRLFWQQN